ncbi:glycosyltransferase family 39 protein [Mesorhizobium atlanticum]
MPALVNVGPPTDVVEGFMWGREWVLLTYKHPQLPCWLLEISHLLTGSFRWPQYMLSQLMITTTFVLVYLLARDIMGSTRALAAVLLMPSIYFFGWPTPQFNHDYAQMPFWAGISWLLWRAARDGRPGWWLALGLVSGLGLYAKFSTALLLAFGGIWLLFDTRARSRLATPWPWLGLAVFLGIAAPLVVELFRLDFLPLTYAAHRNEWVLAHRARLYYIGVQLAGLCGFVVVLGLAGLLRRQPRPSEEPLPASVAPEPRAIIYLAWMGLGPALPGHDRLAVYRHWRVLGRDDVQPRGRSCHCALGPSAGAEGIASAKPAGAALRGRRIGRLCGDPLDQLQRPRSHPARLLAGAIDFAGRRCDLA